MRVAPDETWSDFTPAKALTTASTERRMGDSKITSSAAAIGAHCNAPLANLCNMWKGRVSTLLAPVEKTDATTPFTTIVSSDVTT